MRCNDPEYTMFAPTQVLRNWCEQRPSNNGDLNSSVAGDVGRILHGGGTDSDFILVPWYMTVFGYLFKWFTVHAT